uniref:C1q domain-containing protein n=1 Tax=Magallana gigas TaxID=29159 RepID=A0A8W8LTT0_MAGGI
MTNMKNEETVIFDDVSLNEGKAYDRTTGIFTAPSDGFFSFTWATLTKGGQYFITEIVHNGQRMAYNHNDGRGVILALQMELQGGDKLFTKTSYHILETVFRFHR